MHAKTVMLAMLAALCVLAAGCARVEEPWVPSAQYLEDERSRTPEQQMALQQRLLRGQTDRDLGVGSATTLSQASEA